MKQNQLFTESLYAALDDVVRGSGGYKSVASKLWPDMGMDSAYSRIKSCLNPSKPEKFGLDTVEWLFRLGRESGIHVAAVHLMRAAGYQDPIPAAPKSPKCVPQDVTLLVCLTAQASPNAPETLIC